MIELPDEIIRKIKGYLKTKCIICNKKMLLKKWDYKLCSNYCWYIFWLGRLETNILIIFLSSICPAIIFIYLFPSWIEYIKFILTLLILLALYFYHVAKTIPAIFVSNI